MKPSPTTSALVALDVKKRLTSQGIVTRNWQVHVRQEPPANNGLIIVFEFSVPGKGWVEMNSKVTLGRETYTTEKHADRLGEGLTAKTRVEMLKIQKGYA